MGDILIIDDDRSVCKMLTDMIKRSGHNASFALTLDDGMREVISSHYDIVFLDVMMPGGSGLGLLPKIRKMNPSPEVIIMTGFGTPDGAELAIRNGAWDYIQKPLTPKKVMLFLKRILQYHDELRKTKKGAVALQLDGIVGSSPQMKACFDLVAQAANSDASVLIVGETGTGKELFSRAIHVNSKRADKNYMVLDCAALPETLVESVLFGHEKGAFTGADKARQGLIKQADGGTLFLDEVGELPMAVQKAFLRVLQEQSFRPVGGRSEERSNFRLVAATNRDLDQMVERGEFRKDLLFRLRSLTIELPPLRDNQEDIKELVRYHVSKVCDRYGEETKGISSEFYEALVSYSWPGNIRELVNMVEGAVTLASHDPTLYRKHLPMHLRVRIVRESVDRKDMINTKSNGPSTKMPTLKDFQESLKKQYMENLIALTNGNIKKACRIASLSRTHAYELLRKYSISTPA